MKGRRGGRVDLGGESVAKSEEKVMDTIVFICNSINCLLLCHLSCVNIYEFYEISVYLIEYNTHRPYIDLGRNSVS